MGPTSSHRLIDILFKMERISSSLLRVVLLTLDVLRDILALSCLLHSLTKFLHKFSFGAIPANTLLEFTCSPKNSMKRLLSLILVLLISTLQARPLQILGVISAIQLDIFRNYLWRLKQHQNL